MENIIKGGRNDPMYVEKLGHFLNDTNHAYDIMYEIHVKYRSWFDNDSISAFEKDRTAFQALQSKKVLMLMKINEGAPISDFSVELDALPLDIYSQATTRTKTILDEVQRLIKGLENDLLK